MNIQPLSDYELLPIYVRVADNLRTQLDAGDLAAGDFLPGEHELARAYGLSRGTIRKALDILVAEGRISRQPGRGTIVLPPRARHRVRRQVAVVWSIIRAIGAEMLAGLESAIAEVGYDLLFSTTEHNPAKESEILERLARSDVAGVVLYFTGAPQNNALIQQITANGIPLVLIDRFVPALADTVSWVSSDNEQGAFDVTRHLAQLGHRRIALVLWTPDDAGVSTLTERRLGYLRALEESGLDPDPALVLSVSGAQWQELGSAGFAERFFAFLSAQQPTAVFFNSDAAALHTYPFFQQRGIRVPDDLSIAGFDRLRLPYEVNSLNLTSVAQDFTRLGAEAGRAIAQLIQDPDRPPLHIRVPVTLHIGSTTAPPANVAFDHEEKEAPIANK